MADWELADSEASSEHTSAIRRFLGRIDPTGEPLFISDEPTILDVSDEGETELLEAIHSAYGVTLPKADLLLPLWKLALQFEDG